MKIPFNKPHLTGKESGLVNEALQNGHFSGDGPFTKKCCKLIERLTGCPKAILTTSCTHALELAALLLEIKPGDEVILPSFTFVSTANAFVLRGATPVFAVMSSGSPADIWRARRTNICWRCASRRAPTSHMRPLGTQCRRLANTSVAAAAASTAAQVCCCVRSRG